MQNKKIVPTFATLKRKKRCGSSVWLECRPVTPEVTSSSLARTAKKSTRNDGLLFLYICIWMRNKGDIFETTLSDFSSYLKLERSLSDNTITGYASDCAKLFDFLRKAGVPQPEDTSIYDLSDFLDFEYSKGISKRSQARLTSAIKSMYRFLDSEGRLNENPCDRLETPKIQPHLPDVLSVDEISAIIESVDLSKPEGQRNRAMLEMLYSCGLRVSELVNLHISDVFIKEGFIKVEGKGSKQRLVPIGEPAAKQLRLWLDLRRQQNINREAEDILFLNRRGGKLSRIMVYDIVKEQTG